MFKKFIDESEIEDWFEEEKVRLQKKYYKTHYAGKGGEDLFNKEMSKLLARYDKEHYLLVKREKRSEFFRKPFVLLKEYVAGWKKRLQNKRESLKERFQKWRFDKEYDKLMKK